MHTVVQYPSKIEEANLRVLNLLKREFDLNVGYSDHSPGSLVALASVALGACVIEKHFTSNNKLPGPDHPHSMEPEAFQEMVQNIRLLEVALGDGKKNVQHSENETRIIQRRGLWTTTRILKGEKFSKENFKALRPFSGTSAAKYNVIIGKKAKRDLKPYQPIKIMDF